MTDPRSQLLSTLLDGELSPADAAAVGASLSVEEQNHLAALAAMGEGLRAAPLPLPDAGAQTRWLRDWQITRDRSVRRLAGWMTVAASVVLGVTLSTALSRPAQAQPVLADWETAAVAGIDDDDAPRAAKLIAIDLSLPQTAETRDGVR